MSGVAAARRVASSVVARRRDAVTPNGRRLPLSALRARADADASRTDWKLEPDGVLGRALEIRARGVTSYPLALGGEVTFTGRAMLFPHDWRDLEGAIRASVSVTTPSGTRELWARALHAGDRGRSGGYRVSCVLPADATELQLAATPMSAPPREAVARMIWVDPALYDPAAPAAPRAEHQPAERALAPASSHDDGALDGEGGDEPLFSVLVPVHDPPLHMLQEAVQSVRDQSFGDWQLCLVDDGSRNPDVITTLNSYAADDPRITLHRHDTAGGISAATNAALQIATGRYIALLDHDDLLDPRALELVAERVRADPGVDMIYSDEDIVENGARLERHPKPGWSPEHMTALMYTCHLGVYRRTLATELGGFQTRFDGCQDFDFVLRLTERTDRVAHIPHILYHWRAHPASTATFGGDAKPHAFLAQPAAIADHLRRTGVEADVRYSYLPGIHRIVHRVDPQTSVAFVLALRSLEGLEAAVTSWADQPHRTWSVSIAAPASLHGQITELVRERAAVTLTTGGLGDAAAAATGAEHLLLMQTPAAGLTDDWLTRLIGYSAQPGIAAAGPVLLSGGGRIVNGGVALPEGLPLHLMHGMRTVSAPPAVINVSAVSGVLITPADTYGQAGGVDDGDRELALIDYCLRAGDSGRRIVAVPDARLRLTGPDPAVNDLPALWRLQSEWTAAGRHDPYYNAGYRTDRGDSSMRP